MTDSAVIILFADMLGAGDMFTMATTSLLPLSNGLFVIPMAWLAAMAGNRRLNVSCCLLASIAYFFAVSTPCWGRFAVPVLISMIILFAFSLTGFIASWFPLLDGFVRSDRRPAFFGRMRFCHQVTAVVFLFLVGLAIGDEPPIWKLQVVLLLGAIIFSGRAFFVARLPTAGQRRETSASLKRGLLAVLKNRPLVGFSIYWFVLNLAAFGTVPLAMLTLRRQFGASADTVVLISALALTGMLLGYLFANRILARFHVKRAILGIHVTFALTNLGLAFVSSSGTISYLIVATLLFLYGFMIALASIVISSEMMAMANEGNKIMSMAVSGALTYGGAGGARLITSLVLGSGVLASRWHLAGMEMTTYQTLFFVYTIAILLTAKLLPMVPAFYPHRKRNFKD